MLLLFVMSALAIAVLLNITGDQDRRAREQSLFFAQRAIEGIRKGIRTGPERLLQVERRLPAPACQRGQGMGL